MSELSITNIITINIEDSPIGLAEYNVNNICIFTDETPIVAPEGNYVAYKDATSVGVDWGTTSETYLQAVAAFSQSPNLLNGNGNLIVIPRLNPAAATSGTFTTPNIIAKLVNFNSVDDGAFKINVDGGGAKVVENLDFGVAPTIVHIKDVINIAILNPTYGTFVTSDISANIGFFDEVADGAFKISVNGATAEAIGSLDFGVEPTLSHVADVIEAAFVSGGIDATAEISGNTILFTSTIAGATSTITLTSPDSGTDITGASFLDITTGTAATGRAAIAAEASVVSGRIVFTSNSTGASSSIVLTAPTSGTDITGANYMNISYGATVAGAAAGLETIQNAIIRSKELVFYLGISSTSDVSAEMPALANYVQTLNKLLVYASEDVDVVETIGDFYTIYGLGDTHTRCVLYTQGASDARIMAMAYLSRGMSTNFSASNSTSTQQLKTLSTIDGDDGLTQTIYNKAEAAGADIYPIIQGVPKVVSFGANRYFDSIFNELAFVSDLEVAGFNALATVSTKLAQTEQGMSVLIGAYKTVIDKYVRNAFIAPGTWTRPDTFGNAEDLRRNILDVGYYIYHTPVNLQSQAEREQRIAPVIQIAFKEAGAIHSSIVNINRNA